MKYFIQFMAHNISNRMFHRLFRCYSSVRPMDKRSKDTFPKAKSLLKSCLTFAENNLDFMRIYGPSADAIAKDVNLADKTCLITGANSGIGLEMTRCLSSRDCHVVMACRNTYAASVVAKNVCEKNEHLRFYKINLASLKSVKQCSDEIIKNVREIDIVILNAGTFGLPWILTDDMFETTFQVNYLSQFYLLMNIEKILAPDARVVFVASESHRNLKWSFNDILMPTEELISLSRDQYTSIKAYNISKLCCLLAMHYWSYRWVNTNKTVFSAHPGSFVKTRLCRNWWPYEVLYTLMKPFAKTISQAASTPLYCAISPEMKGLSGVYFKDCQKCEESVLAKDFHLSFRIHDLTRDLICSRIATDDDAIQAREPLATEERAKHAIDETLTPSYSG